MLSVASFFDLSLFGHPELFAGTTRVWQILPRLRPYLEALHYQERDLDLVPDSRPLNETVVLHNNTYIPARELDIRYGDATKGKLEVFRNGEILPGASVLMAGAVFQGEKIAIGRGVLVETGAMVKGPVLLGERTEVRQGAYIRGSCLTGTGCVIGHVTEMKNTLFLNGAKAGHFAYLGDSILGNEVNLGAGTKLANLRFTGGTIPIKTSQGAEDSGLKKMGAILGDHVQTGCNSVTNPGTLLGRRSMVLPNTTVPSGHHGPGSLIR